MKASINGSANIYWEHNNHDAMDFGILLHNTSGSTLTVTLNRRSFWSYHTQLGNPSGLSEFNQVWFDYFAGEKMPDNSELTVSTPLTIPAGEARWISLYSVGVGDMYDVTQNVFNGMMDITIKSGANIYAGDGLDCYTFIMDVNGADTVKSRLASNSANFRKAENGSPADADNFHSGSGTSPLLHSGNANTVDLTNGKQYRTVITGFDMPHLLNMNEIIPLYHEGVDFSGNAFSVPYTDNSANYGVVYKFNFAGFETGGNNDVLMKLKFNEASCPAAVSALQDQMNGVHVTVYSEEMDEPLQSFILTNDTNEISPDRWAILRNQSFEFYVVISGSSSLPLEITFEEKIEE